MLTVAMLLASGAAWAIDFPAGKYYFDNTSTNWANVALAVGHGSKGTSYSLTKDPNGTEIYYADIPNWGGADGYYFFNGTGTGDIDQDYYYWYNNVTSANRTGKQTGTDNVGKCFVYSSQGSGSINGAWSFVPKSIGNSVMISYHTSPETVYKCSSSISNPAWDGANLGTISSNFGVIGEVHSYTWDNNPSAFMHVYMGYKVDAGTSHFVPMAPFQRADKDDTKHQTPATDKETIVIPETPGDHTLAVWFLSVDGIYDSNTNNNYVANFTVPGFSTDALDYAVTVNKGVERTILIPYTHYGSNAPSSCTITAKTSGAPSFDATYRDYDNKYIGLKLDVPLNTTPNDYEYSIVVAEPYGKDDLTITLTVTIEAPEPQVVIAEDALSQPGPKEVLSGYLKYTGCEKIDFVGFVYSKTAHEVGTLQVGAANCDTICKTANDFYNAKEGETLYFDQGAHFNRAAFRNLEVNTSYYYRAFLHSTNPSDGSSYIRYSDIANFITLDQCVFESIAEGDTVYYTVDNSREKDICSLRFQTIADAVADMKSPTADAHDAWIDASGFLTRPIVIEVVNTGKSYGNPDDHTRDVSLHGINGYRAEYSAPQDKPKFRMVLRARKSGDRPMIKGGFDMIQSRYITLKDLIIDYNFANQSSHEFSALEFGYYDDANNGANGCLPGLFTDTDIEIINCEVDAKGFNCIHACGCDGLKFDQCVFDMKGAGHENNDRDWGASVKLMGCKNVQFTRNKIKGSHATLLWLQHTQNTLIMNNVFWNDNLFTENVAFIRPMMFSPSNAENQKITKMGIYYNTFYLADRATICEKLGDDAPDVCNDLSSDTEEADFLRFGGSSSATGGDQSKNPGKYDVANMNFMFNNCYSYDVNIKKRGSNSFLGQDAVSGFSNNFKKNNFWAKGDDAPTDVTSTSLFSFGSDTKHIDVSKEVCQSTADNPDGLVIKGSSLSIGSRLISDISGFNLANNTLADCLYESVRPETGSTWTYGAYQTAVGGEPLEEIIWTGAGKSSQWDKRNNWKTTDNKPLNCTHSLASNLKVRIVNGGSVPFIPQIPEWDDSATRGAYPSEYVEAGLSAIGESSPTKFADVIILNDGATIKGVENLKEDETMFYDQVWNTFIIDRDKWELVGTSIMPFDVGGARNAQSGDYYLNAVPQVYMREAEMNADNTEASWKKSFSETWRTIHANEAFAVRIPDEYGTYFLTAEDYYKWIDSDAKVKILATTPIEYTFKGRFFNEVNGLPHFTGLVANKWNIVSNTYPANIDIKELKKLAAVTDVQVYTASYSFGTPGSTEVIHPQEGFLIKPNGVTEISITAEQASKIFVGGTAKREYGKDYRSSAYERPYFGMTVNNIKATGGSRIKITQDELKDDVYIDGFDGGKVFNSMESVVPELYIMEYDRNLASVTLPTFDRVIPLGLRLKNKITVRFDAWENNGIESAVLEDRQTGITKDLMAGEVYTITLPKGTYEGRFFLNLGAKDEEEEIITPAKEYVSDANDISIYGSDGKVVISSTSDVELKTAYITDLSGRTWSVALKNEHYNELQILGADGVYIIKAVGDKMSKTEKVIIK